MAPGDALVSDLNRLELAHAAENANTDVVNLPASGCTNVGSSVECKCKCCKVPVCAGPGTLEIDPPRPLPDVLDLLTYFSDTSDATDSERCLSIFCVIPFSLQPGSLDCIMM